MNKEQKGAGKSVIIIVILIIVCVAGYGIWQQFGKEKDRNKDSLKSGSQVELTAVPEEDDTENTSSDKESETSTTVSAVRTDQNASSEPITEQAPSEENTEALTTEPETIQVTEPVVDDAWKTTYIEYISMQTDTDWTYRLIYLNNDNIPELYMQGRYLALGGRICTYNSGYIAPIQISAYGILYIERSGLIMNSGGSQGNYYDQIFALENNDLVLKFNGSYGVDDNTVYFDESDYIYKYNNTVVSKSEYDIAKNKLFDTPSAVLCEAKYNKQQIISQINSMS